jgi:SOS-response transcriptional repressor LexA
MTRAQGIIYRAIKEYIEANEYSPTIQEIADTTRKSVSTVHKHLTHLEEQGRIVRSRRTGIEIVPRGAKTAA